MPAIAAQITIGLLVLSLIAASFRLIKGPSLADRVVALDLIGMLIVTLLGAFCILNDRLLALDVAVVLAFVAFLSTVGFARFLERTADK